MNIKEVIKEQNYLSTHSPAILVEPQISTQHSKWHLKGCTSHHPKIFRYLLHQSRWIPTVLKQTERDDTPSWKFTLETRAGFPGLEPTFQGFTNWLYGNGLENSNWMALSSMLQIWTQASYENTRMRKETEKPASIWVDRMRVMKFLYLCGKNAHKHQHSYQRTNQEGMPGFVCVVWRRVLHLLLSAGSWALGDGATGVKAEDKPWPLLSASSHG